MRYLPFTGFLVSLALNTCLWSISAQVQADDGAVPEYKPSVSGAPTRRVGGGTRGSAPAEAITVAVLTPQGTGKTTKASPMLYWAVYNAGQKKIEFTLVDPDKSQPVLEKTFVNNKEGIHAIDLAALGIKLMPNVEYEWSIAVVVDEKKRASDIASTGTLLYVSAPESLNNALKVGTAPVVAYAKEGFWYDALQTLSEGIDHNAANAASLRKQRAALLEQVELKMVAEHEH